jgi:hypothetical protein
LAEAVGPGLDNVGCFIFFIFHFPLIGCCLFSNSHLSYQGWAEAMG